jgi:hypothetical protein
MRAGRFWSLLIAVWFCGGTLLVVTATPFHEAGSHPHRSSGRALGTAPAPAVAHRTRIGYADGAPPGFSGGFKEQSCDGCHFENEPNTGPGSLTLHGVPERFVGGHQYPLTVTLTRPGMKLGGFQLAARFEDGTQAGTIERGPGEDKRVAIETQGNVQYANQRRPGAELTGADTAQWTLVWTAPSGAGPVTFHVAANAADNDESTRGDYVFTTSAQSRGQ